MNLNDSKFLVEALVRWADTNLQSLFILNSGDLKRGLILLRQDMRAGLVRFWVQETDFQGQRAFRQRFAEDQTMEQADAYVQRELKRDQDLWVLIHECSDGNLPPILTRVQASL